jgi:phosphoadenosine phosphosulfate reductase
MDALCVAFSGGLDSAVVLDLCVRTFKRVEPFFMYLVPDLDCVRGPIEWAERAYGLQVRQVPHWLLSRFLVDGVYCDASYRHDDLLRWNQSDVFAWMLAETKLTCVATGEKATDNLMRRKLPANVSVLRPIRTWAQLEVRRYVDDHGLCTFPRLPGQRGGGVDLSGPKLCWLAEQWPADFAKLSEVFPYAEAAVYRQRWFGVAS